jgi:UDP-N-acetylglucosamine transferase subunit ALG13
MPFDRMVRAVDTWAAVAKRTDVFAQIGPTSWRPNHIGWAEFLSPSDFRAKVEHAKLVVAHAGMGSILTALERGRPILVMPRRGDLRETRNDHQVATAKRFAEQGRVSVAMDEHELVRRLEDLGSLSAAAPPISRFASAELLETVRSFVCGPADSDRTPKVVTRRVRLMPLEQHEHV